MKWVKRFYTRQRELLESASVWDTFSPADPPAYLKPIADAVERIAGPGSKAILELGCGGGIIAAHLAHRGHKVTANDLVDICVASARRYASMVENGELTVVHGSFYEIRLADKFDVVCYFDGFGIGSDSDQRRLLHRIAGWLKPEGCALIDVYFPGCPSQSMGEAYQEGNVMYRGDFDADGCRLEESMWSVGEDESQAVTQRLRCYSPADFRLLLQGTGLVMPIYEPYAGSWEYEKPVPLKQASLYLAKLVHED